MARTFGCLLGEIDEFSADLTQAGTGEAGFDAGMQPLYGLDDELIVESELALARHDVPPTSSAI